MFNVLKKRYGKAHVSFAEPLFLDELLDRFAPDWREKSLESDDRPAWLSSLVDELGQNIMTGINEAVTP